MTAVVIKLLTLWMLDDEFNNSLKPHASIISNGIWETRGVEEKDDTRIYELVCVMSHHRDIKIGDKRTMYEDAIIQLCHEVKVTHLPKIDKRDVIIDSILNK